MTDRRSVAEVQTANLVTALLDQPPSNHADLVWRLRHMDAPLARHLLVDKLEQHHLDTAQLRLLSEALQRLGPGGQRQRLQRLALDPAHRPQLRLAALTILAQDDPTSIVEFTQLLAAEEAEALLEGAFEIVLTEGQGVTMGEVIVQMLREAPDDEARAHSLRCLERARHQTGVSATAVYQLPLRCADLSPHWGPMVEALVHEPEPEALALLEALKIEAEDAFWRRRLQMATLQCHTESISPTATLEAPPEGYALVSNSDGQSAFSVVGVFTHADGASTLASLTLRATGDIYDGFRLSRQPEEARDDYLEALRNADHTTLVRVPLLDALPLVLEAERLTRAHAREIPQDAAAAVRLFTQMRGLQGPDTEALPAPTEVITLEAVDALLSGDEYGAWWFTLDELNSARVEIREPGRLDEASLAMATRQLDTVELQARLSAMTRFMARWHHWRGEDDSASLCVALHEQLEEDFTASPLVRQMLLRGLEQCSSHELDTSADVIGGPRFRQSLKAQFFSDVEKPTARDLARLDFTEAAYIALQQLQRDRPDDPRMREEALRQVAWVAGRNAGDMAQHLPDCARPDVFTLYQELESKLREVSTLSPEGCTRLIERLITRLYQFRCDVCAACPRHCLRRPDADRSADFYATQHPKKR